MRVSGRFKVLAAATLAVAVTAAGAFAQSGKKKAPGTDIAVAKDLNNFEDANYTTIQAAVNAAKPGQVIEILDTEVYAEQVTIDGRETSPWAGVTGGKNGITIRYVPPAGTPPNSNFARPTIQWRDINNTSPKNSAEAGTPGELPGMSENFETCGALRIIRAQGVTIDGIAVDGVYAIPFGANGVYGDAPLFHGNAAIALAVTGGTVIRNCDVKNAYFGIYVSDRNTGGVFATSNPNDKDVVIPLAASGKTGGHLVEYSRVHNNSVGVFFERAMDLGSTVRYNLIYNNLHTPATSAAITIEKGNQNAGAFLFKDMYLTPLAIYNNTLHSNTGNFLGNWQTGGQHLIFNNIFSGSSPGDNPAPGMVIDGKFPNRMYNCLFVGDVLPGVFPASANVRSLERAAERLFKSVDPTSPDFLIPDWNNAPVQQYIKNQGWTDAGIRNSDGTLADLGAAPSSGRAQTAVARIKPSNVVWINGNQATVSMFFTLESGAVSNPKIKFLRWVSPIPDNAGNSANDVVIMPAASIHDVAIPTNMLSFGSNQFKFTLPSAPGANDTTGFFEMVVEGTDANGNTVTSDVGFLPYRRIEYYLDMAFFPPAGPMTDDAKLNTVKAGEPVRMRVSVRRNTTAFSVPVNEIEYQLLSNPSAFMYNTADNQPLTSDQNLPPDGQTYNVYFSRAGEEVILGSGVYRQGNNNLVFLGNVSITVLPGDPAKVMFLNPIPKSQLGDALPPVINHDMPCDVQVEVQDKFGNAVGGGVSVTIAVDNPAIGDIDVKSVVTNDNGVAAFVARVTNGSPGQTFDMTATMTSGGVTATDVGRFRVGLIFPRIVSGGYIFTGGVVEYARLTFNCDVSPDWFDNMEFTFGAFAASKTFSGKQDTPVRVRLTDVSCISPVQDDPRTVLVDFGCAFPETPISESMAGSGGIVVNFLPLENFDSVPVTVTANIVDGAVSTLAHNRVIPPTGNTETVVIAPVNQLTAVFTVGPNPVGKSSGNVAFFWQGKRIDSGVLVIYNASGNTVKRIPVNDKAVGSQAKRAVGSWDLTDRKGRPVPEGTYLVKGKITASGGKGERVSAVVGVR